MRIISWNCNGALQKKLHKLKALNADLCIIQECEDPLRFISEEYQSWAKNHLWMFLQKHEQFLTAEHSALIGDLNSNACWDVWDRWWNHSDVVRQLQRVGLASLYHHVNGEAQGAESKATFYLYRKREKPLIVNLP